MSNWDRSQCSKKLCNCHDELSDPHFCSHCGCSQEDLTAMDLLLELENDDGGIPAPLWAKICQLISKEGA